MTSYIVRAYRDGVLVRATPCTSWLAATKRQRFEGMSGYTTAIETVRQLERSL